MLGGGAEFKNKFTMHSLFEFLFFPRGILAIFLYICLFAIPLSTLKVLLKVALPITWNIPLQVYAQSVRFIMANGDWMRVRNLTVLYDFLERILVWFMSFKIERVRRKIPGHFLSYLNQQQQQVADEEEHPHVVDGAWLLSKGDVLPDNGADEWKHRVVVLWAHGGGYGSGCAISFASAHCHVINSYNRLESTRKPLLYFSVDYPLAPGICFIF